MKRKDISLETRILPRSGLSLSRSTGEASSVVSDTPGDISAYDGRYAFSCSWDWEVQLSEGGLVSASLTADDFATLSIGDLTVAAQYSGGPGTGQGSTTLPAGSYRASLRFTNIDYQPPSGNVAVLSYSLLCNGNPVDGSETTPDENAPQPPQNCGCEGADSDAGGASGASAAMFLRSSAGSGTRERVSSSSAGRNTRLVANETYAHWQTDFGKFRGLGGIPPGTLEILAYEYSDALGTPEMLEFSHPLNAWLVLPEDGIGAGSQLKVCTGGSYTSWLCDGRGNEFFPIGTSKKTTETLSWNADKTALILTKPDKSEIAFSAADGEIVSYKTRNGNALTAAELSAYIDIVRDADGVLQQVRNSWDGLASVENVSEAGTGYTIALYLPEQVGEKDAESGLYAVAGTPFKTFTVSLSETAPKKLTITELDSRTGATPFARSVWFENGAWSSSVGTGTEEILTRRTRTAIDDTHFRIVTETLPSGESVPAACVEEIFEIHSALGNLCVSRTQAYGTDYAQTTTYGYDSGGRLTGETHPDGSVYKTTYDRYGRVSERYEPCAGALFKITYYEYASLDSNNSDLSSLRVVFSGASGWKTLSETLYAYTQETEFRRVERRTTALGSENTQFEVEETFLGTCENVYARGRVKMRQARSGVQTHYDYAETSLYGALYTQTAETRIDGEPVAGKSSREVKFISSDGNTLRSEKYLLDSAGTWRLVASADFEYDAQNRETRRTRGNGRVSSRESMCCGTLWEIDEDGVRTDYVYNTAQQLTEKTRALTATQPERTQLFTRDAAGRVTREVLKLNSVNFSEKSAVFDALGRPVSETDELGRTTTYAYAYSLNATAKTRTETATLPSGATRITTTHADGTVLSEAGTSRRAIEIVTDAVSDGIRTTRRLAGTTDAAGILSREIKNGFGETIRTATPDTLGSFVYTHNTFDSLGLLSSSQTGILAPTLYEYDAFGNETKRTLALADEPTALNSRITETSTQIENRADGVYRLVSTTTYNASGTALVTSVATLVSESTTFESKTISTDALGNATTRRTEFGELGMRISKTQIPTATNIAQITTNDGFTVSQIDHAGTQTGFARQYNTGTNAGIVLTTTDGRGNATIVEQNVLGWTTKTTDAAGNVTTTAYDLGHGKPSCVTDALGKTHCYAYDLHGNVVAEFGTGTQPAVFSFDDADNTVSQKLFREEDKTLEVDPRSRADLTADETTWSYHATTGLLLTKTYPDGGRIDYAYDAQNRLASTTWTREVSAGVRLKATRSYAEKTGELISVSYNDGTVGEAHSYNHLGQLTQTVDASGTRVYVYNNYNEIESETLTALGAMQTPSYDAFGREIYTTLKRGDTTLALFGQSYDAASGRIASGAYGNAVFAFSYLSGTNLVSEIGVMNGYVMTKKISYEANRDLPTEIAYEKPEASLIAKRNYDYDALGRVSARTQTRGNGTPREDTFGYNPRSELISATLGNVNYAYAFDNIGNRTSSTEAGTQSSYSANALNQYDSIFLGEAVSSPLQYDADGNATLIQTPTGTWAITYNGANRPIRFENAETQTVVECAYDSQGRRFEKKVTVAGTMTLRECYLYKGYLQIAAFEVSGDEETLNYTLKRIVYWDPTEPTATRPLAVNIIDDGVYFPTVDLTKNVCELVDAYGDIVATYDYAPFGAVTAGTPSGSSVPANPLQWSSEVYDSELDLVYYNYRHYSPTLGRFLSRDPIQEQGGRNLYAFVKNATVFKQDFLGWSGFPGFSPTSGNNLQCRAYDEMYSNQGRCRPCSGGVECRTTTPSGIPPTLNGCGNKDTEWVPDSFFGVVSFTEACNNHDICYGTCGVSKSDCDRGLGRDMANACEKKFGVSKFLLWDVYLLCLAQAKIYEETLLNVDDAEKAFEEAQDVACAWEVIPCMF